MYKYLYEKDWKDGNITRKLFKNEDQDLQMQKLDYLG